MPCNGWYKLWESEDLENQITLGQIENNTIENKETALDLKKDNFLEWKVHAWYEILYALLGQYPISGLGNQLKNNIDFT